MATSARSLPSLHELEIELLWGAWVELGVSGWESTHRDWVVDPEPLIIRTAEIADSQPRLRDEALDWCIHYWRYISKARLRTLLREGTDGARESWGIFAATVNEHSSARWPGESSPARYKITGRSSLASMKQPSQGWLRMRAIFGVSARTEILRYFLSGHTVASTATIASSLGYTRANVITECDSLERAGVLRKRRLGKRYLYTLSNPETMLAFVGALGPVRPSWTALLGVTSALVGLEDLAERVPAAVLMVESHRAAEQLDDLLDELDIEERPVLDAPDRYWTELNAFAYSYLSAWAAGVWEPSDMTRKQPRRTTRR